MSEGLRWDANGLIPAVVQEAGTGELLMVAWMDREALEATKRTGLAHFHSRSRGGLWQKGETSGHRQHVRAIYADCDRDTLLLLVGQEGVACHTGARTCFFERLEGSEKPDGWEVPAGILDQVVRTIESRKASPQPGSYVSSLIAQGEAAVLRKIGEEATELLLAALTEGDERLVSELADLWFHTLVLLGQRGIPFHRVLTELAHRHAQKTTHLG
jgi:phosphoribosyl-ATP pyrophosphohydrolase/phosphoribosyl-AMP cyclohydrolase